MSRRNGADLPAYYTTQQVAQLLGVSAPTVVNWVKSGWLPASRTPGGHRRLRREDVDAFARAHNYVAPDEPSRAEPVRTADARLPRVVVVDDDVDFAELVRAYLERGGPIEVHVAHDGFAAGFVIARVEPDVVVLDLRMPTIDGFEVLRRMRADPRSRSISVIACTAFDEAERGLEGFDGVRACFRKTMPLERLAALVREAVRASR